MLLLIQCTLVQEIFVRVMELGAMRYFQSLGKSGVLQDGAPLLPRYDL